MDAFLISYFLINIVGSVSEIIKSHIRPESESNILNDDASSIYKILPLELKVLTFVFSIVLWIPYRLLKPLVTET